MFPVGAQTQHLFKEQNLVPGKKKGPELLQIQSGCSAMFLVCVLQRNISEKMFLQQRFLVWEGLKVSCAPLA